ncbi:MAG: phosphatidylglycerol lysyltransferase domain-containing protein [Anaerovoracaceae bacterium]
MNILKHCFEELTEKDITVLEEYFNGFDYQGSGYTFIANYIWRNTHCVCWEIIGEYLCIAGADCISENPKAIISMPLTKTGEYDAEKLKYTILETKKKFDQRKLPFSIELIPSHMVHFLEEAFPEQLTITHDRDDDEYVYLKEKLITLSGRALHKKKNHLNYFLKTYEYEYKPITKDMIPEIKEFVKKAKEGKTLEPDEMESLELEETAISEALEYVGDSKFFSGAIFIDGKIEAFTIGELLSSDTAVAHFEKANDEIRGLYQCINSEFCKHLPEEIIYVNREEDMGIENLRHAKESYKPDHMAEKYSACFSSIDVVE